MADDRSMNSQKWVMFQLGLLQGQQEELLKKVTEVIAIHEASKKGLLKDNTNILIGQEHFIEVLKRYQANVTQLLAYAMMWRLDWRQEHGDQPVTPTDLKP